MPRLLDADCGELPAQEGVLHALAAAIKVLFHAHAGPVGIAAGDGVDDFEVGRGGPLLEGTELHAEGHEPIDLGETALDQFLRERVARRGRNGHVEAGIGRLGLVVIVRAGSRRTGGSHRDDGQSPHRIDFLRRGAFRGARRRGSFEQSADVERVVNRLDRDARDEISVTNHALEVPLLPQTREAFADRCPAHPVLTRQAHFRQRRSGRISSADDAVLDALVRTFDLRGIRRHVAMHHMYTLWVQAVYMKAPGQVSRDRCVILRRLSQRRPVLRACLHQSDKPSGARYLMRNRAFTIAVCVGSLFAAVPAAAQYGVAAGDRATGETYRVEVGGYLWSPAPTLLITSESLGIAGDQIDFVEDLGIEKKTFRQLKVVLRPGTKHKFRFEYTPIGYDAESRITRSFVFNGQRFDVSLPVTTEVNWDAYRFGYEWDFVYRDRGFVGLLLELKYTDIDTTLSNAIVGSEFVRARAPIPAIGIIGRGYVAPNISITGEFTGFKLPTIEDEYRGSYYDFDLYGTVNFNDHVGAQLGYRRLSVFYHAEEDEGDLKMKGLYFGGVVRF